MVKLCVCAQRSYTVSVCGFRHALHCAWQSLLRARHVYLSFTFLTPGIGICFWMLDALELSFLYDPILCTAAHCSL